jgi:hypothetical protein
MSSQSPQDWSRIPGATRAHLLPQVPPAAPVPKQRSPWMRSIAKKPLAWGLGLLLTAIGGFVVTYVTKTLEKGMIDPILAYDVTLELPPSDMGRVGYTVPGSHTDLEAIDWNEHFGAAEAGGIPSSAWVYEHGGMTAGWGIWHVVLEGQRDSMVTVTDLRAVDVSCTAPVGDTFFIHQLEGLSEPSTVGLLVDAPTPTIKLLTDQTVLFAEDLVSAFDQAPGFGQSANITLERGEQHEIQFIVHAMELSCTWKVAVDYTADGDRQTMTLDPVGVDAFALEGSRPLEEYETVIVPWNWCPDQRGRALTGGEAAQILAGKLRDDSEPMPECPPLEND